MYETILIPTDGSEGANAAVEVGTGLATQVGATVRGVHVVDIPELPKDVHDEFENRRLEEGRQLLQDFEIEVGNLGKEADSVVLLTADPVHEVLLTYADRTGVDCIVMGTAGRTGVRRLAFGSVAERTVRHASVPVVTVHADASGPSDVRQILVPVDGSDGAASAVDHAVDLAESLHAGIHLLHVVDLSEFGVEAGAGRLYESLERIGEEALEQARTRATAGDVRKVEASLTSGRASRAILAYADDKEIDLIVMGTHGRSGMQRIWLGSTTERLIRRSTIPVLTVKPHSLTEPSSGEEVSYTER